MEALIEKFHNLGGTTISEHQKNFSAYRRDLANSEIDFNAYFSKLQPNNRQEEIFRIKLLQENKRHDVLYEILKTGDKINGQVILNNLEFLSVFEGVSGADFVQKICPELSYVNRLKIVNRLRLKIENFDTAKDYFENVRNKYGLKTAKPLLNACDEEFIKEVVVEYDLRLNQALLIRLYKKYPNFLHFYYSKFDDFEKHEKVGKHVANSDLKTYHSLLRYGSPKLGKCGLKRFLKHYKLEVLKYPNLLQRKRKVLLQNLSRDEFLVYLRSKLPQSVDDFQLDADSLRCFKALPRSERGAALFECFKKRYGFDLTEEIALVSDDVLEILSSADRLRFDLEDRPEMLPTSASVPKLQALFLATKNHTKKLEWGGKLLKTCRVNDDDEALLEVLKFFCENWNPMPTKCFEELGELPLERLSAQHWDNINELRLCYQINNKERNLVYDRVDKLMLYKMLNGIDYIEDLKTVCKKNSMYFLYNTVFKEKYATQERECIIKRCEILGEIFEGDEYKTARKYLLQEIISFNQKHPKLTIPYQAFANVLSALLDDFLVGDRYPYFLYSAEHLLRSKTGEIVRDETVLEGLMQNAHKLYNDTMYFWFMKNRPDLVEKYSDALFEAEHLGNRVHYEISKMHYSGLYKVFVDKALDYLKRGESRGVACSMAILSNIKSIDLQPFIGKYLPDPECRIDASKPDILTIQKSIISTIKNSSPPSNNITRTLYFCKGDYLKYALEPLYHSIHHSPENMIEDVLDELLTRAVSVRKHTLHLVTCVGTVETKFRVLKRFAETETNASLKCFTIMKLLRSFLEERNQRWFGLLKEHIGLLSSSYWDSWYVAFKFRKVPKMFLNDYAEMLWKELQARLNPNTFGLLRHLKTASDGLSQKIIKECLYNKNNYPEATYSFTHTYLLNDEDADVDCIKPPKVDTFEQRVEQARTSRIFLQFICKEFLKNSEKIKRKIVVLNRLSIIFKGLKFKLLIDITKLLLINMNVRKDLRATNEDFMKSLKDGVVSNVFFKRLEDGERDEADHEKRGVAEEADSLKSLKEGLGEELKADCVESEETMEIYLNEASEKNAKHDFIDVQDVEETTAKYSFENINVRPSNEDFMKILSNFILYQLQSSLEIYGSDVIPVLGELIRYYLEDIYKEVYGNAFELLLRLVEVILDGDYLQEDTVIFCIFLLPKNSTKVSGYKKRRREVVEKIRETGSDVVKIYLSWFLENCQK